MQGASSRDPARQDLPPLGNEGLQQLDVLPIDVLEFLRAKLADFAPADEELLASRGLPLPFTGPSALRHRGHHSLLSGIGISAGAASAGTGAGRGGRRAAFRFWRSAAFAARFNSSSA